ncbi:MAG: hypothetical protein QOJ99_1446, partial [Bryobacterales bacterium]|nr:hypothetical protein [Bryobacterales bacterium]
LRIALRSALGIESQRPIVHETHLAVFWLSSGVPAEAFDGRPLLGNPATRIDHIDRICRSADRKSDKLSAP